MLLLAFLRVSRFQRFQSVKDLAPSAATFGTLKLCHFETCSYASSRGRASKKRPKKKMASFSRKRKRGYRNAGLNIARVPNPMFPVSRRELAPSTRDI